jgi:hypothetical protein
MLTGGGFVAVWESNGQDGSGFGIFGRRFDVAGVPVGAEFRVNTTTFASQLSPAVGSGAGFVVAWNGDDGGQNGVVAQRYASDGTPLGEEFVVNAVTTGLQFASASFVAVDGAGNFSVAWTGGDPSDYDAYVRFFDAQGIALTTDIRANVFTADSQGTPVPAIDPQGRVLVAWTSGHDGSGAGVYARRFAMSLAPASLAVDASPSGSSDGNHVLESCEAVTAAPAWQNVGQTALSISGSASGFVGPAGATYVITDANAQYGTITPGATVGCSDCYGLSISCASPRPTVHWDASFLEELSQPPAAERWTLHVGESFGDVPRSNPFYRFVETLLHRRVTGGCTPTTYCPSTSTTREQMAVFVLVARDGADHAPPACDTPVFADVPALSPFCRWIEELARRGVVTGCGGGNYCPTAPVSREQMAVFVLRTLDPVLNPPACGTPLFADVPASSPFCRWIEELARRGVVTGCGGGNYCPAAPVTREQMGVFITTTFGLTLYGP